MYLPGKSCVRAAFILEVPVLKQLIAWNISTLDFVKFALIKDKVQGERDHPIIVFFISLQFRCKSCLVLHLESPTQMTLMPPCSKVFPSPSSSKIFTSQEFSLSSTKASSSQDSSNIVLKLCGNVNRPTDHL